MTWIWIPITLGAAVFQVVRTAIQKHLKGRLSTNGANYTRYVFGLPFAVGYALLLNRAGGLDWPRPDIGFFAWVLLGGVAQIVATSLLIEAMTRRNFAAGIAYSKTEILQAAMFEAVFLGIAVTVGGAAAIALATLGVMLISLGRSTAPWRDVLTGWTDKAALLGLGSGGMFAVSAVSFRAASVGLGDPSFLMSAGYTLAWAQTIQTTLLTLWLALREPGQIAAVARAWRPGAIVGLTGTLGSIFWFTAFTIQIAAYVRTLGLAELILTFLIGRLAFGERASRYEVLGVGALVAGILLMLHSH